MSFSLPRACSEAAAGLGPLSLPTALVWMMLASLASAPWSLVGTLALSSLVLAWVSVLAPSCMVHGAGAGAGVGVGAAGVGMAGVVGAGFIIGAGIIVIGAGVIVGAGTGVGVGIRAVGAGVRACGVGVVSAGIGIGAVFVVAVVLVFFVTGVVVQYFSFQWNSSGIHRNSAGIPLE